MHFDKRGFNLGGMTCAEVSTMMVMVTTRLDPAPEARISLCMCMTPLGNACMH